MIEYDRLRDVILGYFLHLSRVSLFYQPLSWLLMAQVWLKYGLGMAQLWPGYVACEALPELFPFVILIVF